MIKKIRVEIEGYPMASDLLRAGFEIGKKANPGDEFRMVHIKNRHVYVIDIEEKVK